MTAFLKKLTHKIATIALNNPCTNWLLIAFSLDHLPKELLSINNYSIRKYIDSLSPQENVGYSHLPAIQKLVDNAQDRLVDFAHQNIKHGQAILDIGCGTGIFLSRFSADQFHLYGIDLNRDFLDVAEKSLPKAHLFNSNYVTHFDSPRKFNLICSFSVTMYIEPSRLELFFDKIYNDLNPGGYVFIQYSQAMKFIDLLYPNLTYIKYSPHRINKVVTKKFNVVKHEHFYDGRKVDWYDTKHYYFPDGTETRLDTLENSFLLILQKPADESKNS